MWTPDEVEFPLSDPVCHSCYVALRSKYYSGLSRSRGAQRANRSSQSDDGADQDSDDENT